MVVFTLVCILLCLKGSLHKANLNTQTETMTIYFDCCFAQFDHHNYI